MSDRPQEACETLEARLEQRTRELGEALDQQAATSEILRVISTSPTDVKPVFETIVRNAVALCDSLFANVFRFDGEFLHFVASNNVMPGYVELLQAKYPMRPDLSQVAGRVTLTKSIVRLEDALADPDYDQRFPTMGWRRMLGVPMMREKKVLGVIVVGWAKAGPVAKAQEDLLRTFADQAVIAIENVRLFEEVQARTAELMEALQQQTATADVLKVISRSTFDLQAVLNTLVESATHLCDADGTTLWRPAAGRYRLAASYGGSPEFKSELEQVSLRADGRSVVGRTLVAGRTLHIPNMALDPDYARYDLRRLGGYRAMLGVPLMREGVPVGVMMVGRQTPKSFTDKQIELATTFADQAVIAIENTRLFEEVQQRTTELSESLGYQTATSDVLSVISRSPTELQPVLNVIVETAARMCAAEYSFIARYENNVLFLAAELNVVAEHLAYLTRSPINVDRGAVIGRVVLEKRTVHVPDVLADPEFNRFEWQRIGKQRTVLGVPLFREDTLIGVIILARTSVQPFTQRHIELVTTFADQAVIAIENVRLFEEVQARTRELQESLEYHTATGEILNVISRSPTDLKPVMDVIAQNAARVCGATDAQIFRVAGGALSLFASYGALLTPEDVKEGGMAIGRTTVTGRAVVDRRTIHVADLAAELDREFPDAMPYQHAIGHRTTLATPLLREGVPLGVILIRRMEVKPFSDKQIALLETFANQAVIAIENARLFEEVQAKTADLEEALTFRKGTAEVLEVIGRSASELQPVLDAIMDTAADLCRADMAVVRLLKDGALHYAASSRRHDERLARYSRRNPLLPNDRSSVAGRVAIERRTVHIHDVQSDPDYTYLSGLSDSPVRSALGVPLMHEENVVGVIILIRRTVDPFTERQIALVETFADQAVIAIGNVRLFEAVQRRTEELSRSLQDLRTAQDRLIQTEKLASLGQLTAGIAHEIKNPLNFVNNFSAVSGELIDELREALRQTPLDEAARGEIDELTQMLKSNLDKVVQHGKRADSIVKNMLLHSREGSGEHRPADVNSIVEESLNLAYHGARAEGKGFNITLERNLDPEAGEVDLYPQEISRVLLNLIANGFYATTRRKAQSDGTDYEPTLSAATKNLGDKVEIRIRDNGAGIPAEVKEKMFNPFFTTKPAGEGTGLGLSLSHDIVVKQHSGTIEVDTEPGRYTEFRIVLPRDAATLANREGET